MAAASRSRAEAQQSEKPNEGGNQRMEKRGRPGPSFRGAKWMGVGVPLNNSLGFKHHPLEGAGMFKR